MGFVARLTESIEGANHVAGLGPKGILVEVLLFILIPVLVGTRLVLVGTWLVLVGTWLVVVHHGCGWLSRSLGWMLSV